MRNARRFMGVAAMVAALLMVAGPAGAAGAPVEAHLDGAQEVPGPGDFNGWGTFWGKPKPGIGQLCFFLHVVDIAVPIKGAPAHIHAGAAGVAGPVVISLGNVPRWGYQEGYLEDCLTGLSKPLLQHIANHPGDYYVNVHNGRFPAGAVRGQLHWDAPA